MKKIICLLLTIMVFFSMMGCGTKATPEDTVIKFNAAMKAFDWKTMADCVLDAGDMSEMDVEKDEIFGGLMDYFKRWANNLKYKVLNSDESGDKASVTVEYIYTDASEVFADAMTDYFTQAFAMSLSGASDDEMSQLLAKLLVEKAGTAKIGRKQITVIYPMVKLDGEWKIEQVPEDAMHVATSDLLRAVSAMADAIPDA